MRLVDVRASRFEQAIIVVVLLAGFVFRQAWSIPIALVFGVLSVILGTRSPAARLWDEFIAPRRPAGTAFEPAPVARMQSLLIATGLLLATLVLVAGSVGIASIVAGCVAVVAALGATGVVSVAAEIRRRGQHN